MYQGFKITAMGKYYSFCSYSQEKLHSIISEPRSLGLEDDEHFP